GLLRPPLHPAIDPSGGVPPLPGERGNQPTLGLPAPWTAEARPEQARARGGSAGDAAPLRGPHPPEAGVPRHAGAPPRARHATPLRGVVRERMADLPAYAVTQKLLAEVPRERQKLVADLVPAQITVGGVQRVLQALLAERVSIRDLPTILEGIQEACTAGL